jgi:hypothetical protein
MIEREPAFVGCPGVSRLPSTSSDNLSGIRYGGGQASGKRWEGYEWLGVATPSAAVRASVVEDDCLCALWRLLAMTGARRGEALGLRWDDVDIEGATITIRRSLGVVDGVSYLSDPKTKRGLRTIALDPVALDALKAHAARQADELSEWGRGLDRFRLRVHARGRQCAVSLSDQQGVS